MRKLFGILLAVLLVVTWSACFAEGETIKIGAIFPLSGSGSDNGWHAVNGASLAIEEINERGGVASLGGAKLELVTADNLSDANQCKAVAERTLEGSGVVACIGAGSSAYVVPMLPVFEKAQVPFITAQISDSITSQGYQFVFETAAQDQGLRAIRYVGDPQKRDLTIQRVIARAGLRTKMRMDDEDEDGS